MFHTAKEESKNKKGIAFFIIVARSFINSLDHLLVLLHDTSLGWSWSRHGQVKSTSQVIQHTIYMDGNKKGEKGLAQVAPAR
jgi:hypothetical protein